MSSRGAGLMARILRNTGILLGGKGMAGVMGLAGTALAVRALGLHDFGILQLVHTCASLFSVGTRFQSWQPLLHFGSALFAQGERTRFQALLRHCFLLDMIGAAAGMVLALCGVAGFGTVFGWPAGCQHAALVYMTTILFMNTCCALGVLRLTDRFKQSAIADLASSVTRVGGTVLGLCLHWHLPAFLAVWYASNMASFAANNLSAWRAIRHTASFAGFRALGGRWLSGLDGIWRLTLATSGNQAVAALTSRMGVLLVGAALDPAAAGIYSVTWHLCDALAQPAQLLTPALYPELIRLRDGKDWVSMRRVMRRIFQALGVFSVVALLVAFCIGPFLFRTLLAIHRPDTLSLLMLLSSAAILDLWDVPLEPLLVSLGWAQHLFAGRVAATVLCMPVLYGLAHLWGVDGAGVATLLAEALILATRFVPFRRLQQL
ncbi:lipopolysaccharide biosynthesis protein [Nguyenibacter vanlangensis]|uniref:Lipopolysaccharide biosynthesis protein n=1 Tax=Nguyenibacter vanlangensis TaxID=1216886 RepID=A0ABZ3D089_9PROT